MELNFIRVSAEISDRDLSSGEMKLRFVPNHVVWQASIKILINNYDDESS